MSGVVATETRAALYSDAISKHPPVLDFIGGLGGREVTVPDVEHIFSELYQAAEGKKRPATQWIGLRE